MSDGGPRKIGVSVEVKPHAYDPIANPELFEGVLARRCLAFVIDVIIIAIPVVFAAALSRSRRPVPRPVPQVEWG